MLPGSFENEDLMSSLAGYPNPAPYRARAKDSAGRRYHESEHRYRSCFERDRDRIVHSRAFRRLEYKTQVFPNYEGDHFRTRLTHTIEVAQIARTVASALALNQTLAEAIALAHDLGHPPFGHAGEQELDSALADAGGFEHNRHTLRIVEELEERYAAFPGLNLTYEVREGIVKHSTHYDRFQKDELKGYHLELQPMLEAQIIDWVDGIAYNVHDIDDGVEAKILSSDALAANLPLFREIYERESIRNRNADERQLFNESIRALLDMLVSDLIDASCERIKAANVANIEEVRSHSERLIGHSPEILGQLRLVAKFLREELYCCPQVETEMQKSRHIIAELVASYRRKPTLLPERHQARMLAEGEAVVVGDYVAGMTDRFALEAHRRLHR
jgi:dGTPase